MALSVYIVTMTTAAAVTVYRFLVNGGQYGDDDLAE